MKFKVEDVLKKVKDNRDNHRVIYEDAMIGYKNQVINALTERLDNAVNGKKVDLYIRLEQPEDHTDDYITVIEMLEMTTDEVIDLNDDQFRCFIQDQWEWRRKFIGNAANYTKMI